MTFKVHGSIFRTLILKLVRFKKDVILHGVLHTGARIIYLTVGDRCRVFPLHRMYERVDTAVVIWCWTSG